MKVAIDSSAIIAILGREPGFESLIRAMSNSRVVLGAPTFVECARVLDSRTPEVIEYKLADFIHEFAVRVVSFDDEAAGIARFALNRFGKGSGHPAKLNYGDGMSYAIAKRHRARLLYVGNDFDQTDLAA